MPSYDQFSPAYDATQQYNASAAGGGTGMSGILGGSGGNGMGMLAYMLPLVAGALSGGRIDPSPFYGALASMQKRDQARIARNIELQRQQQADLRAQQIHKLRVAELEGKASDRNRTKALREELDTPEGLARFEAMSPIQQAMTLKALGIDREDLTGKTYKPDRQWIGIGGGKEQLMLISRDGKMQPATGPDGKSVIQQRWKPTDSGSGDSADALYRSVNPGRLFAHIDNLLRKPNASREDLLSARSMLDGVLREQTRAKPTQAGVVRAAPTEQSLSRMRALNERLGDDTAITRTLSQSPTSPPTALPDVSEDAQIVPEVVPLETDPSQLGTGQPTGTQTDPSQLGTGQPTGTQTDAAQLGMGQTQAPTSAFVIPFGPNFENNVKLAMQNFTGSEIPVTGNRGGVPYKRFTTAQGDEIVYIDKSTGAEKQKGLGAPLHRRAIHFLEAETLRLRQALVEGKVKVGIPGAFEAEYAGLIRQFPSLAKSYRNLTGRKLDTAESDFRARVESLVLGLQELVTLEKGKFSDRDVKRVKKALLDVDYTTDTIKALTGLERIQNLLDYADSYYFDDKRYAEHYANQRFRAQ